MSNSKINKKKTKHYSDVDYYCYNYNEKAYKFLKKNYD